MLKMAKKLNILICREFKIFTIDPSFLTEGKMVSIVMVSAYYIIINVRIDAFVYF